MTDLFLYNSRTRQKEAFVPLTKTVRMYVCGPTVYDRAHVGNARPIVVFDVLYRLLKTLYEDVVYVRNVTDVDDKIIDRAQALSLPINTLTQQTLADFHDDCNALYALSPTHEPKATEFIPQMITFIQKLLDKNKAYIQDHHVLFDTQQFSAYGVLSLKNKEDLLQGARVDVADYKKDPCDFVLWKPALKEYNEV